MYTEFIQNKMNKVIITLMIVIVSAIIMSGNEVFAVNVTTENITLTTVDDISETTYHLSEIKGMTSASVITLSSDNTDVAGFCYYEEKVTSNVQEGETIYADSITAKGSNIKLGEQELKKGKWITSIGIVAKRAGNATVTVKVDNSGIITSQVYNVTVKGVEPKLTKWKKKTIRTCDTTYIDIQNLSTYGTVTISSNKDKAFAIKEYIGETEKYKKAYIGKTDKIIDVYDTIEIIPNKTGNIDINVKIEQDGYTVTYTYKLNVVKYVNPIKTFKIGNKNYAKKFNKKADIATGRGLTKKECKYTLGKTYKLKLKKGYKLVKITYRKKNEWGWVKPHTLKKNSTKLPKDFWELYIVYKDKKGRKWTNSICYSFGVFE